MSKKTLKTTVRSGNEYVLQVKGNQPSLLKAIKQTIANNIAVDGYIKTEKNRGRIENREVYVYSNLYNPIYRTWRGIKKVIHVVSKGKRSGTEYEKNHYYITNKETNKASIYGKGIRWHWFIENRLHWVKDVTLNEDNSKVKDLNRSENLSVIRNIVLNLYHIQGYRSIKYAIERHANRLDECINLIYNNFT